MKLGDSTILLTGATGGIGSAIAARLARAGARVIAIGRDERRLAELGSEIERAGGRMIGVKASLATTAGCAEAVERALAAVNKIDAAVFAAGVNDCSPIELQPAAALEEMIAVNLLAPMALSRGLVPHFQANRSGALLFVGSVLGAIGFPYFAAYSATKFGVRGFAEALRRELEGSGIAVSYVAPRGTRTAMIDDYRDLADASGMTLDPPEEVAERIVRALELGSREATIGRPERFFIRLNSLLPAIVDGALRRQAQRTRPHAQSAARRTAERRLAGPRPSRGHER